jgi:hypothetical protein
MTNNSHVALALVLGGIVCMLASMGGVMYLYHEQAAQLAQSGPEHTMTFVAFAGLPALVGFVAGGVLLAIGIMKDRSP